MDGRKRNCWNYFENRDCKYFPCHDTDKVSGFNCMFCYCPLYLMGDRCGGDFTFTAAGVKDCSKCLRPHETEDFITEIFNALNTNRQEASI